MLGRDAMRWVETRCIASLDSEIPEGIILSILTDYEKADVEKVIEEIIYKLQKASKRESQLNKSIQQLLVLSRLRKFDKKIEQKINNMPIIYDISNANPPLPAPKVLGTPSGRIGVLWALGKNRRTV